MSSSPEPEESVERQRWQEGEALLDRFEAAWLGGERAALEDFWSAGKGQELALLVELVCVEIEVRLKAGEGVRVEPYLKRFPELGRDPAVLLELLVTEFEFRRRQEPALSPADYARRFPAQAAALRTRLGEGLPHRGSSSSMS